MLMSIILYTYHYAVLMTKYIDFYRLLFRCTDSFSQIRYEYSTTTASMVLEVIVLALHDNGFGRPSQRNVCENKMATRFSDELS